MKYYDNRSPIIVIRDEDAGISEDRFYPKRYFEPIFPTDMAIHAVDEIILRLLEVADETSPRFAFLYYYQVIEYVAFYFVNEKTKTALRKFLRDPTMIGCPEDKVSEVFVVLSEIHHNDDVKMKSAIKEFCDPNAIWREIVHDKEFFTESIVFDGGFELPPLISIDTTENSWSANWVPILFDNFTKIRNCIVHARERRQGKVILPSDANNRKINRYLPLISRVAMQIAIRS